MVQTTASQAADPLIFQTGTEVYNSIMREIEPELLQDSIPLLEMKYANETPVAKKQRGERYRLAFEEYDRRYAAFELELQGKVRSFQKAAMKTAENSARTQDEADMVSLESSLSSLD